MNLAVWGGGLISIVVSWCCGATLWGCFMLSLAYGWCLFISSRRLTSIERLLAAPLGGPPSTPFASSGSKRIDAIKRAIIHLKIRGEVTEGVDRERAETGAPRDSYESEEELCRRGQRWVSSLSGAVDGVVVIVDEQQGLVMYGPLGDSPRYRAVIERLYGGYLRSGFGTPTSSHDDASGGSIFGGFSELGFCYALIHPLGWESHGVTRRGMVWVGFPPERPPAERTVKEFHRSVTRLEEELRVLGAVAEVSARAREAESSNARKSEFLTHISHDLRSPLNTIRSVLSLLKVECADQQSAEIIDVALRNCDGVGELVGDILDFARFKEGRLQARLEIVDIREVVDEVLKSFDLSIREKNLKVIVVDTLGRKGTEFDRRHLRRITSNLVGNAIKYTERGTVRIELRGEGDSSILVVEDSGIGMTSDEVANLFTPFSRFGDRRTEGVGLGLIITKALVEANGGSIDVRSTPFVGSTVTVTFGQRTAQMDGNKAERRSPPSRAQGSPARVPTVLLVDDDRDSCASLARALSGFPVETLVATTVPEGMSLFNFAEPDVVVTDLGMPLGGGERFIEYVRASRRRTPIYCLSGVSDAGLEVRDRVQGVFQKPVDVRALVCALEGAVKSGPYSS